MSKKGKEVCQNFEQFYAVNNVNSEVGRECTKFCLDKLL